MSKLKEKRLTAIRQRMLSRGIEYGSLIFMSMWDLADTLNNCWHAADFMSPSEKKDDALWHYKGKQYALHQYYVQRLFRGIRHAVKDSDIELRESYNNKSEYLVMKAPRGG